MGKAPNDDCERSSALEIASLDYNDREAFLLSKYHLKQPQALEALGNVLSGFAARDQEHEAHPMTVTERRKRGYELAGKMRDSATLAMRSMETILAARVEFDQVVGFWPPLLEAIFDTDTGPPTNLYAPANIDILMRSFAKPELWDEIDQLLQDLANLPVRPKLSRGPLPDVTLRNALIACRDYWVEHERRNWSMSALKNKETRQEGNVHNLQGCCERFVADVLTANDVAFDLWHYDARRRSQHHPSSRHSYCQRLSRPPHLLAIPAPADRGRNTPPV